MQLRGYRQAAEVSRKQMRDWYRPRDLLSGTCERIIPETSTLAQTTALILADTQLLLADRPAEQLADLVVLREAAGERGR